MTELAKLHPAGQVAIVIAVMVVAVALLYFIYKVMKLI